MKSLRCKSMAALGAATVLASSAAPALADPCGFVPPITMIEGDPIVRVDLQKSYIAYYQGVETIVVRPGFEGKADEFGMLTPFPSVPAIRKVDEDIFSHLAAAVDPPEVLAYVQQMWRGRGGGMAPMAASKSADSGGAEMEQPLRYDEVRVLNQEAIGMYEVATLAAGSADALKKWMKEHGFRWPDGMEDVANEYVALGWVFVAVKAKVGQRKGVDPKPGMKEVNPDLPDGSTFNGHVQAMGFRFKTDELVAPMRLGTFNKGVLHNLTYILTDDAVYLERIPKRFVRRQISGEELYRNVTGPLPLRVIGGSYSDLTDWQKQNLVTQRKPEPHNGLAKELFASDLLAMKTGVLANPVEEKEKELLAISERLGLRGKEIDVLHAEVLQKARDRAVRKALKDVKKLTMTVLDGEFDRDTLAKDNLRVAAYKMPAKRNKPEVYDVRHQGPRPDRGGKLYRGATGSSLEQQDLRDQRQNSPVWKWWGPDFGAVVGFGALALLLGFGLWRRGRRGRRGVNGTLVALAIGATVAQGANAWADRPSIDDLIAQLGKADKAQQAAAALARHGQDAVDALLDAITDSDSDTVKGWAIVALADIGGADVDAELQKLHDGTSDRGLVRTWAAAARIDMARDADAVMALAPLVNQFPALQRPLQLRLVETLGAAKGWQGAEKLLDALTRVPQMAQTLQPAIVGLGSKPIIGAMTKSSNVNVRQMAAAYLPLVGGDVAKDVVEAYRFRAGAKAVPWDGGALYVPGITWSKDDARALVEQLLRWHLWAELNAKPDEQTKIHNNLVQWQLVNTLGYGNPGWQPVGTDRWLSIWGDLEGRDAVLKILKQQGVDKDTKWRQVLADID